MRVALISPRTVGPDANPGWYMITNGIRNLVRMAVPDSQFMMVEMMHDDPVHWAAAATCDVAILCGNPRFTLSPDAWWEGPIWHRLLQLQAGGIKVIDGWSGSAYKLGSNLTLEEMAEEIATLPRNVEFLQYAGAIHARITRDPLMQRIYEIAGVPAVQLPCSSWWAAPTVERSPRDRHAISLVNLTGRTYAPAIVRGLRLKLACTAPVDVIASTWDDYLWAKGAGLHDVQLLPDPDSLIRAYQNYDRVLAFRIHSAIPAASQGCEVHTVSIDTRTLACGAFNIPCTPVDSLNGMDMEYRTGTAPDTAGVVEILRGMLCN